MAGRGYDTRAVKRYATALFQTARKAGSLDRVEKDIYMVMDLMRQMPALQEAWLSPLIPARHKHIIIAKTLGADVDTLTLSFLDMLIDKRREDVLEGIEIEIRQLADESRHIMRAEATFAVEPTAMEQADLVRGLEQRTGWHVTMTTHVDPNILGGVIVRMQDTIIDGSVRGTLERIREQLLQEA